MNIMRSHELLNRRNSRLLVIDVQQKLVDLIPEPTRGQFIGTCQLVCQGATLFGVPVTATEQYPKGIGPTVPQLAEYVGSPVAKQRFSSVECLRLPTAAEADDDRFQIVVIGMETHVCVLQTVLDLLAQGYQVYVVVDAVTARGAIDHNVALERLASSGAVLTTAEGVLFEWCESSDATEFKQFSALIKARPTK